ncbi:MAG: chromate transporter, partial [Planktomarina sp.]
FGAHIKITQGPLSFDAPILSSIDPVSLVLTICAAALLLWRKWDILWVLPALAILGLAFSLL